MSVGTGSGGVDAARKPGSPAESKGCVEMCELQGNSLGPQTHCSGDQKRLLLGSCLIGRGSHHTKEKCFSLLLLPLF